MDSEAQRELDRVRALGARAIDDFGTGFSSLSRLADLPANQLKIDRAFVAGLGESPESLEIVHDRRPVTGAGSRHAGRRR